MDDEVPSERVVAAVITAFTPTTNDDGEPDSVRFTVQWKRSVSPEDKHTYIGMIARTAFLEMMEHLPDVPPMHRDEVLGAFIQDVLDSMALIKDYLKGKGYDCNS